MGKIFKINCRTLYETALYLDGRVEQLKKTAKEMKEISEEIESVWSGTDYDTFHSNFTNYLNSLQKIENEMLEKSRIMKEVAMKHSNIDVDLMNTMDKNRGVIE